MNVLAFDTCFDACSAAVGVSRPGGGLDVVGERSLMSTGHAEALLPIVSRVVAASGLAFSDITRIAVTNGPGTFTGTRIGVSAARAFALTLGVPVVAFSSLRAIAARIAAGMPELESASDLVLVARDARRGEAYVEAVDRDGRSETGPHLLPMEAAAKLCPGQRLFVVGSAAAAVVAEAERAGRRLRAIDAAAMEPGSLEPDARQLLAWAAASEIPSKPVGPIYFRAPDAKPQEGKALPRRPVDSRVP